LPRHDTPTSDALVTIEATTVEEAMERLAAEVGPEAEIVDAQKVHRGGLGGFFAKEKVMLTARAATTTQETTSPSPATDGLGGALASLTEAASAQDVAFGELLQREMSTGTNDIGLTTFLEAVGWDRADVAATAVPGPVASEDPAVPELVAESAADEQRDETAPVMVGPRVTADTRPLGETPAAPPPADPTVRDEPHATTDREAPEWRLQDQGHAPAGLGPVAWGSKQLVRHGIPGKIVNAVAGLDPRDDLGWINGLAEAVADMCGPLPTGDFVLVGAYADRLAGPLGLPLVGHGDTAPYEGSFAAVLTGDAQDRPWLEFVRGNRDLHLMIGEDDQWRDLLITDPAVVSWVGESSVVDALYLAATLGATLGFGTVDGFVSPLVRALPVDVALAVRRLMERH
jgi:hypothetical protein